MTSGIITKAIRNGENTIEGGLMLSAESFVTRVSQTKWYHPNTQGPHILDIYISSVPLVPDAELLKPLHVRKISCSNI